VNAALFVLAAMSATVGILVVAIGWLGRAPEIRRRDHSMVGLDDHGLDHIGLRLALGAAAFIALLALTGWPVAALYGAMSGFFFPTLAVAKRRRREAVDRIEAIAVWVESLRDTTAASAGIQEALRLSARVAPAPVRTEVRDLALRLQHHSVAQSLRRFAADMKHPLADMVVASLILATGKHAGSLQGVLAMTAKGARDSASMWRQIESSRTRTYAQSRLAGWISFSLIVFLILTRRSFLEPFDSFGGQIALAIIGGAFFLSGVALYRLGRPVDPRRLFAGVERSTPDRSAVEPNRILTTEVVG
jgi:tight adherence protein B